MKKGEKVKITISGNKEKIKNINTKKVTYIEEEVAYWRKANQIHNWFIKNCGDNDFMARSISINDEKLEELLKTIILVLKDSKLVKGKINNGYTFNKDGKKEEILIDGKYIKDSTTAQKLLPTSEGFFFGSTDYDEYYIQQLKYTKKVLENLLKENNSMSEYYYEASW